MPLITDPDQLNQATEVDYATGAQTITLNEAGNLDADGVTPQAVYSFTKEEWLATAAFPGFDFPFVPLSDEFYELVNGWNWANQASRNLLRRGGFLVRNTAGNVIEHWAGIAILGAEADDQIYYDIGAGATDFVYTGNTAEVVQVISDPNGDGNYADGYDRSSNITVYNREQGQLYSQASSSVNGEANIAAPKLFSFTLNTGADLNITASDVTIAGSAPYTGMSITYFATAQQRNIGGTNRDFGIIIDGNNGTLEQIYEFVQYQLRQDADIDAGAGNVNGKLADLLLEFIGGTGDGSGALETLNATNPAGGGTGVYIDNFLTADTNRVSFRDNTETVRTFPFVAGLTINFNDNLQNDTSAEFWVYFTDANGNTFGSATALLVDDNGGSDMTGTVSAASSTFLDFDYDGNNQGGRTPGTDADVTVIAIGTTTGQHVKATGTITRSTTNSISLVAPLERNYANP